MDAGIAQLVASHLSFHDINSLLATCRSLRAATGIGIRLASCSHHAQWVLQFAERHAQRFTVLALKVINCSQTELDGLLRALPGLQELNVTSRITEDRITSINAGSAVALRSLRLNQSAGFSVAGLALCPRLTTLVIHTRAGSTPAIVDLPLLRGSTLSTLHIRDGGSAAVEGLRAWSATCWPHRSALAASLASLHLTSLRELEDAHLPMLASFRQLRDLKLALCKRITSVRPLGQCSALRSLTLTGCEALTDLAGLSGCTHLTSLYLTGCRALVDVTPLVHCVSLETLHLNHCNNVVDAGELRHCPSLQLLFLRCSGVTVVPQSAGLRVQFDNLHETRVGVM